jgi:hypothetical protein
MGVRELINQVLNPRRELVRVVEDQTRKFLKAVGRALQQLAHVAVRLLLAPLLHVTAELDSKLFLIFQVQVALSPFGQPLVLNAKSCSDNGRESTRWVRLGETYGPPSSYFREPVE